MTERLELSDATLREWDAVVLHSDRDTGIVLDRSAFYPGGGGQPPDHGVLLWGGVQTRIVGALKGDDVRLVAHDDDPLPPVGTRSGYLKVRDRAAYEFALTSAAAALLIEDGTIVAARLALGPLPGVHAAPPPPARAADAGLRAEDLLRDRGADRRRGRPHALGRRDAACPGVRLPAQPDEPRVPR